jgi:tRNA(His) 5'-end guanylyltransferase
MNLMSEATKDSLGDRMKAYEGVSRHTLTRRTPVILRIDGKAFHTFLRQAEKPFDPGVNVAMTAAAAYAMKQLQGCVFAYTQSDEISLLLKDWQELETQPAFGNCQNKLESIAASAVTAAFNRRWDTPSPSNLALFDARAFNLPVAEVTNYFIWRQQDATRNSIQGLGQFHFSAKQLHGRSCNDILDMLVNERRVNWNDLEVWKRRGTCIVEGTVDLTPPVFTQDRKYIERLLAENVGTANV